MGQSSVEEVVEVTEFVPWGLWSLNFMLPLDCTSRCPNLHAQGLGTQAGFCASSVPPALASLETETSYCAWGLPSLSPAQQENSVVA